MKKNILILVVSLCVASCFPIRNKKKVFNLNEIGDSNLLKKNGYYYTESVEKAHPYYRNAYGGYSNDTTIIYDKIEISTLVLNENGSCMQLGIFSGMQENRSFNYEIKCALQSNNTKESALNHFECYFNKMSEKKLSFIKKNSDIWNQGVYKVFGDSIKIQTYYVSISIFYLYEEIGTIKNDTTFVLTNAIDYENGTKYKINKTYKFKKMDNRPEIASYILKNKKKFNKKNK